MIVYTKNDLIVMIHERNGSRRKNPRAGDLTCLFTMDYLLPGCGLQSSDYRYGCLECICSRSEPLFCKNCTFWGGYFESEGTIRPPKKILYGGRDINPCPIPSWILDDLRSYDSASWSKYSFSINWCERDFRKSNMLLDFWLVKLDSAK